MTHPINQYLGCIEHTVAHAIRDSKVISGDVVQIPYSTAAEHFLLRECETCDGLTYAGTDIDGNDWTVELVP